MSNISIRHDQNRNEGSTEQGKIFGCKSVIIFNEDKPNLIYVENLGRLNSSPPIFILEWDWGKISQKVSNCRIGWPKQFQRRYTGQGVFFLYVLYWIIITKTIRIINKWVFGCYMFVANIEYKTQVLVHNNVML